MENKDKYHFTDFTHESYSALLSRAKERFEFAAYTEEIKLREKPFALWRHDVDFSVHEALNLARLENSQGIKATYFILLHSDFYNVFETEITKKIREIISLGHYIGLHFDPAYYAIETLEQLVKWLDYEKQLLATLFSVEITVFSFHNPTEKILAFNEWSYAGLINTYAKWMQQEIKYCSDSNGYWRHSRMFDFVESDKSGKIQALTHPEWWTERVMSPKEKVWRCADKRAEKTKEKYVADIASFGRNIIDW